MKRFRSAVCVMVVPEHSLNVDSIVRCVEGWQLEVKRSDTDFVVCVSNDDDRVMNTLQESMSLSGLVRYASGKMLSAMRWIVSSTVVLQR